MCVTHLARDAYHRSVPGSPGIQCAGNPSTCGRTVAGTPYLWGQGKGTRPIMKLANTGNKSRLTLIGRLVLTDRRCYHSHCWEETCWPVSSPRRSGMGWRQQVQMMWLPWGGHLNSWCVVAAEGQTAPQHYSKYREREGERQTAELTTISRPMMYYTNITNTLHKALLNSRNARSSKTLTQHKSHQ